MHDIFEAIAHHLVHLLSIEHGSSLDKAVHFLIADGLEIFIILYFAIFLISIVRKQISPDKLRDYLSGKNKALAYLLASLLGCIIPFCACSAIPLFLGFVGAGVPLGICATFLLAAASVNEIGAFLLITTAGADIAGLYVLIGITIAIIGGYLTDKFNLKSKLKPGAILFEEPHHCLGHEHNHEHCECGHEHREQMSTLYYAHHFAVQTIKGTWIYILVGVILGATIQGFVPDDTILKLANADNPLAVPTASIIGILLYAPHGAVIPIFDALLQKGIPLGTSMVVLMSTVAISIPELALLKKIFSFKLLAIFVIYLLATFNLVGYILNF